MTKHGAHIEDTCAHPNCWAAPSTDTPNGMCLNCYRQSDEYLLAIEAIKPTPARSAPTEFSVSALVERRRVHEALRLIDRGQKGGFKRHMRHAR